MNNLSTSGIKSIKEKLVKFKNKLFNNNNKIIKDLNECKGIKDIRHLFKDNIYKGIRGIRYLFNGVAFNEDYYIENSKSEFKKLSNNLVNAYSKDIRYMVDYINNDEKLEERPINLEDIREKFIVYSDYSPFGIKIVSSVIFDDEYKILKTESRMMAKSLKTLKIPIFLMVFKRCF